MFAFKSHILLAHTTIYFELISVYHMKEEYNLILFHVDV